MTHQQQREGQLATVLKKLFPALQKKILKQKKEEPAKETPKGEKDKHG